MNPKISKFAVFVLGAVAGSLLTWKYAKKKYERIAQQEIDSVKDAFSNTSAPKDERPDAEIYADIIKRSGYAEMQEKEEEPAPQKPYVIPPETFGELDDYEKISLTWYADQLLADDNNDLVEDVEATIGFESLGHFGEYEDDSVFVRNDRLKCDYEILLDRRRYIDVMRARPY